METMSARQTCAKMQVRAGIPKSTTSRVFSIYLTDHDASVWLHFTEAAMGLKAMFGIGSRVLQTQSATERHGETHVLQIAEVLRPWSGTSTKFQTKMC